LDYVMSVCKRKIKVFFHNGFWWFFHI